VNHLAPRPAAAAVLTVRALAPACESPPGPGGSDVPVSEWHEVVVLGDGFVRFDGERIPEELFLLRMRKVLRAVPPRATARPGLVVRVADNSPAMRREFPRFYDRTYRDLGSFGLAAMDLAGVAER